ncbi:amidase [Tepidamorphus sp. 3E244]|uniref:amidase n=1 Tax=Tepidamorphus sp. 3E244 TaxID=3385498 RepID=UPI0038FCCE1A
MTDHKTLSQLSGELESGKLTARALVDEALERAQGSANQGDVAFISIDADTIRAEAESIDKARAEGNAPSPYAGIPVSIKDLFDVKGQVTAAGSTILASNPPAAKDAEPVARLRAAGFIPFGRANMTEFAFSGLGMNAHYGDPASPWQRGVGRVAGGSSSGGAVSVAEGIVPLTLGTDTGGSCRIPAACCGIVGYKPTAVRVPQDGTVELATSLDSIGPLGNSVDCCARAFGVLAGGPPTAPEPRDVSSLRLGVLKNYVLENMDQTVAAAYEAALDALAKAGATLEDVTFDPLDRMPEINARGGLVTAEALRFHKGRLAQHEAEFDQRVSKRIRRAETQEEGEYDRILLARREMIDQAEQVFAGYDAIVMPTIPIVPPKFEDVASDDGYTRNNLLLLRNPSVGNWLDRCAISLPVTPDLSAPVGFMLMGVPGNDEALFACAFAAEQAFAPLRT